ncbi:MAG TPA: hypothetical protein VLC92_02010 [Rhodocyclaceae bacterium]|nr:hypothetical protein [Rhodocyclaceae bacterium]
MRLRKEFRHFRIERAQVLPAKTEMYRDQKARRLGDIYVQAERKHGVRVNHNCARSARKLFMDIALTQKHVGPRDFTVLTLCEGSAIHIGY